MTIRFEPTPLAAEAGGDLRRVAEVQAGRHRGELAVTSGQQAGLFSGPLYAVLKALSAAALAKEMGERGERGERVKPVFWVAGDDHDFAEINHCVVLGLDGRPARVVLRERAADAPMLPAYREMLGQDAATALGALEALLPPGDARTETLDWLARAYTPGPGDDGKLSLAEAHARAMTELLAPFGVVVARGWSGDLKRKGQGVLLQAARRAAEIDTALAAQAAVMRTRGQAVPVEVGEGLTLLMLEGAQGRDRLRITGPGRFATRRGNQAVTLDELERILQDEPERLSGNVLLRPVVEAAVFPTVGYFGGPGELAYLEQTAPLFQLLDVPRPARLPRLSGLLVEAKVDKVLERYQLVATDLAQSESALAGRIAREGLPESATMALSDLRAAITERYAAVQAEAGRVDKTLERPVENARNQALVGTQEIEKKLVAALKRTFDTAIQQVARARDQLYPEGQPQERILSAVSFLGRHGRPVLDLLFDAARRHASRLLEAPPAHP